MILVHYKEKKNHACSICCEKFATEHLLNTHNIMFHVIKPAEKKTTKTTINHRKSTKKVLNQSIDLPKTKLTASEIKAPSGNGKLRASKQLKVSPTSKEITNKSELSKSKRKSAIAQKRISLKWKKGKTSNSNEFIVRASTVKELFLSSNESTFIDRPDLDMEVTEMGANTEESFVDKNSENKFESPTSENNVKKSEQKIIETTTTNSEPQASEVQNGTFEKHTETSETKASEEHTNTSEPPTIVHEEKNPYISNKTHKCSLCGKLFLRKSDLNEHLRSIHEGKNFQCEICDLGFTFKRNLTRHVLKCCGKKTSEPQTIEITTTESELSTTEVQTTKSGTTPSEQQTPEPPTIKMPTFNSEPAIIDVQFSNSKSPASEKYTKTSEPKTIEITTTESELPNTELQATKSETTASEQQINRSEPQTIITKRDIQFPKSKSPVSKEYTETLELNTIEMPTTEFEPAIANTQTIANVQTTTFEFPSFTEMLKSTTNETKSTEYDKQNPFKPESKSDVEETIEERASESMSESINVLTAELKNVHDISCNPCNKTFNTWKPM